MGAKPDEMKDKTPTEIRHEIEQTRDQMSGTIDEIQYRLNPERLKRRAKDTLRENTVGKVENMADDAARKAKGVTSDMFDTIKKNPVPAALVAVGLGWLFMERKSDSHDQADFTHDYDRRTRFYGERGYEGRQIERGFQGQGYTGQYRTGRSFEDPYAYENREPGMRDRMGQTAGGMKDRVSDAAGNVGDKVSHTAGNVGDAVSSAAGTVGDAVSSAAGAVGDTVSNAASAVGDTMSNAASTVSDTVSHVADQAQMSAQQMGYSVAHGARRARSRFEQLMDEKPMLVGAAFVAVGAAIGMSLPTTQKEQELMGETRDRLFEQAGDMARDTADKVQHVAEATLDTAKEKTKETVEAAKATVKDEAQKQNLTK